MDLALVGPTVSAAVSKASSTGSQLVTPLVPPRGCRAGKHSLSSRKLLSGTAIRLHQSEACAAKAGRRRAVEAAVAVGESELDVVSKYSEIVPDTVVGDDFERFKPTAATVTSSLILGISSLPEGKYDAAIESALAYGKCLVDARNKFSCFLDKALVNVGAELLRVVPGRVSTEVDPRLAHNTAAIIDKVRTLVRLYNEVEVPQSRILFKIPATWEGIDAARQLEDDGIQTHVTGVNSFAQAAACAQAQVAVIQISVGRVREWARTKSGDVEISAAVERGEDPGVSMVNRAFKYIAKHGHKTKVMASNIRTKEDVFGLLGVDYLIVPLRVLEALLSTPAQAEGRYDRDRAVSASTPLDGQTFSSEEMSPWTKERFDVEVGPCAKELLEAEIDGAVSQTKRTEEYLAKIWPPPNV